MKTYRYFIFAAALAGMTMFNSCSSFLNEKPTNASDSENAIATTADAQVMINGLMRDMSSPSYYGRNFLLYGDAKGGDFAIVSQGRGMDGLYTFNHNVNSGAYEGFWSKIYDCLLQANNLLKNIDKLEADKSNAQDFSQYKGQALTARAMFYFDLVRLYGKPYNYDKTSYGVPLVLEPLDASAQPTRATVAEVYAQIVTDLKAGAALMSKTASNGYLSYYANLAEQARVYLYMEDYANALAAAKEIIDSKKYTLYTNAQWASSWSKQWGSESIFEIGIYPNEADLEDSGLGAYMSRIYDLSKSSMGWFLASDSFLARLGKDAGDIRWGIMSYDELSKSYDSSYSADRYGACYKYLGGVSKPGDGKATNTAVNIKVIRLSEIYLIAAEAALGTGGKAAAADYLNAIRKRSPDLAAATSATVTTDMILDERSKELYGEGQRFFDMMRCNKSITFDDELIVPAINIPTREKTIDRSFFRTILPIGLTELNANPAIAKQQNPGY